VQEADIQKMSAAEREDAVNEIRLLASIRHENVCRYHEAFVDGNYLCIVMEFAPNGDLGRFIRKGQEFKKVICHLLYMNDYLCQIMLSLADVMPENRFGR
jgi:serine/threonine protein kinase